MLNEQLVIENHIRVEDEENEKRGGTADRKILHEHNWTLPKTDNRESENRKCNQGTIIFCCGCQPNEDAKNDEFECNMEGVPVDSTNLVFLFISFTLEVLVGKLLFKKSG